MRPRKSQTWTRREVFRPPGAASVPSQCSPVAHPLHNTRLATGLACRTGFLRHCGITQESNRGQAQRPTASNSIPTPQAPWRGRSKAEEFCAPAHVMGGNGVRVGPHLRAPPRPEMALFSFLCNLPALGCDPLVNHLCQQRESCHLPLGRQEQPASVLGCPTRHHGNSHRAVCKKRSTVEWNTTARETGAEANQC